MEHNIQYAIKPLYPYEKIQINISNWDEFDLDSMIFSLFYTQKAYCHIIIRTSYYQ
jgi:hypothetical protein